VRRLRVLHVTPYFEDAWAYGGIPRAVAPLARAQARAGHAVTVLTTDACDAHRRTGAPPVEQRGGVTVHTFRNVSNALAYRLQLFVPIGLAHHLARHATDHDVAHLHACHNLPGAIAASRLARARVPWVLSPHGTAPLRERRWLAKRVFDLALGGRVIDGSAGLVAVSEAERRDLLALGVPGDRIAIVPNPVDDVPDSLPVRSAPDAGRRRHPVVLFLGKVTPRKRLDVLVRAFATLRCPDAQLVIAGNDMGGMRAARRLSRSHALGARVRFTGLVRGVDRFGVLGDADVVVYPAREEVFGLVAIEALLVGTPVVVADDSGCGEVIRLLGGGLVVREGDPRAFAGAIDMVLADPRGWRHAACRAGHLARRAFASDRVAGLCSDLYAAQCSQPPALAGVP
jgi:glycosyltransferase involved in cell wall biosynthesis